MTTTTKQPQGYDARDPGTAGGPAPTTAAGFVEELLALAAPSVPTEESGSFRAVPGETFLPVRMGAVFALAKRAVRMPLGEVERLLESEIHEARVGAVSIMDYQARRAATPADQRGELFQLYLRRHDRINNWDLVDRAAPYVVGGYLYDKPRGVLDDLARSDDVWQRRTAIVATYYFIRQRQTDDTFRIAEILVNDDHDLVQRAVGGWIREAGKVEPARLTEFLDAHAAAMPRIALRMAVEHLDSVTRQRYLGAAQQRSSR